MLSTDPCISSCLGINIIMLFMYLTRLCINNAEHQVLKSVLYLVLYFQVCHAVVKYFLNIEYATWINGFTKYRLFKMVNLLCELMSVISALSVYYQISMYNVDGIIKLLRTKINILFICYICMISTILYEQFNSF